MKNKYFTTFPSSVLLVLFSVGGHAAIAAHNPKQCPTINGSFKFDGGEGDGKLRIKTSPGKNFSSIEIEGMEDGFEDPPVPLNGKTMLLGKENGKATYRTASCKNQAVIIEMKTVRKKQARPSIHRFTFRLEADGKLAFEHREMNRNEPAKKMRLKPESSVKAAKHHSQDAAADPSPSVDAGEKTIPADGNVEPASEERNGSLLLE